MSPTIGWWILLAPVRWSLTLCAAHRTRNVSLRVESSPMRSLSRRSLGSRPASRRRIATASSAIPSQSAKNSGARRVEEHEAGDVTWQTVVAFERRVERVAETVGVQDVEASVADVRREFAHGIEESLHCRPNSFVSWTAPWATRRAGAANEVEQVVAFGLVELQRPRDRFEDVLGDAADVAAFEARVVLDADPGERGDLLAAQAGDAPVARVDGQSGLFGGDLGSPCDEELAQRGLGIHDSNGKPRSGCEGVPGSTPVTGTPSPVEVVV